MSGEATTPVRYRGGGFILVVVYSPSLEFELGRIIHRACIRNVDHLPELPTPSIVQVDPISEDLEGSVGRLVKTQGMKALVSLT